jgi:hypothetical protein
MEQLLLECSLLGVCTRVLTLSPTIVTVKLSYNYWEPFVPILDFWTIFRGQSKIPSDNTVYKEEILSHPRQTPPAITAALRISWAYLPGMVPSESVVLPPSHDCRHLSYYIKRFAMSCAMLQ